MRTIDVSTSVYALVWANRQEGEETEDAILRRLLGAAQESARDPAVSGGGVLDARSGVHFPEGFRIFRRYKGREFAAVATGGQWRREDSGTIYPTLNQLNSSIAAGTENVWNGNWKFKERDSTIKSIDALRRRAG
jgi:hypothetical protein